MNTVGPFINRPTIYPDESQISIVFRSAHANHHASPKAIVPLLGLNIHSVRFYADHLILPRSQALFEKVQRIIGLTPNEIQQSSYLRYGPIFYKGNRTWSEELAADVSTIKVTFRKPYSKPTKKARYCPLCLAEAPHIPNYWLIPLYQVCHIHSCLLEETCLGCHNRVQFWDVIRNLCPECNTVKYPIFEDKCLRKFGQRIRLEAS